MAYGNNNIDVNFLPLKPYTLHTYTYSETYAHTSKCRGRNTSTNYGEADKRNAFTDSIM